MDKTSITLTDEQVFQLSVDGNARDFRAESSRSGESYHIGRFQGKGFTCTPDFYEKFSAGEVQAVTLTDAPYEREVDDPLNPNTKIKVTQPAWSLDGFTTYDMLNGFLDKQAKVVEKRANLEAIKSKVLGSVKLDDKAVATLANAI